MFSYQYRLCTTEGIPQGEYKVYTIHQNLYFKKMMNYRHLNTINVDLEIIAVHGMLVVPVVHDGVKVEVP